MPAINPSRAAEEQLPVECVTALCVSSDSIPRAVEALRAADFAESDIEMFIGKEGQDKLRVDRAKDPVLVKFLHALTEALADDATYLDSAMVILKNGGAMIRVNTGDEEAPVHRAAQALRGAGAGEVRHWGRWRTEQF